ncbi:hypothetical protein A3860_26525 [Niastella vici]|uniref:Protochlamydia outer membrane protein domain-containing protein n=1 Tax=Niastella vici TaxID=1703345 RepID=A0A1V9FWX3_9BACT|nr:hypothetical protein [Niastella vici]OQP62869.1 hypothetical protein A3860_26525 [Niastella vici]
MVKLIPLLLLFGVHAGMAQDLPAKLQVSVTSGYEQQDLRWSIAGNTNGQNPNILSELKWKNVAGPVTGLHIQYRFFNHWQLEGEYAHPFFLSGKVYDTDYGSNDRTNKVYDEQFNAGKGGADRWQAGLANRIPLTRTISITPSAGYGIFHQTLYIAGNTSIFSNLNSTYKTKWAGPYGQILCSLAPTKKLGMNAGIRYSQVRYRASANWNLIREFNHPESFRHTANGYGIHAHTSMLYRASRMHSIGITGTYSCWQTGRGIDEMYLAGGGSQQTQLNEVHSAGWQVKVEWRISFY